MMSVGVVTFLTYMSGDLLELGPGVFPERLVELSEREERMSVWPTMLIQSMTGQRTAAAAKRGGVR